MGYHLLSWLLLLSRMALVLFYTACCGGRSDSRHFTRFLLRFFALARFWRKAITAMYLPEASFDICTFSEFQANFQFCRYDSGIMLLCY